MERSSYRLTLLIIFVFLLGILLGSSVLGLDILSPQDETDPLLSAEEDIIAAPKPINNNSIIGTNTVRDIVAMCEDSVIKIETEVTVSNSDNPFFNDPFFREFFGNSFPQSTKKQTGLGSGFIFTKDGYILTNNHVVEGAERIKVYLTDREEPYEAKMMGRAPELDLAVIKIDGKEAFPYLEMGDSDLVEVGDWVVAIGNPYGLDHTVTVGVISAMGRPINIEGTMYQNLFQTDAAINPGNSGGPMLNLQGQVIGINTAVNAAAQGIGFAIPTSTVMGVIEELKSGNDRVRPWIGINMQPLTPDLAAYFNLEMTEGVIIYEVVEGAPADKAGLLRGDVILSVDGNKITNAEQIQSIIRNHNVGDRIEIVVYRNSAQKSFVLVLEESK